jgi:hypothetical protein
MRRLAFALLVALLTFGISGISTLVAAEPCGASDQQRDDDLCPPTCVTCGCCVQAIEASTVFLVAVREAPVAATTPPLLTVPDSSPRAILHVPKRLAA